MPDKRPAAAQINQERSGYRFLLAAVSDDSRLEQVRHSINGPYQMSTAHLNIAAYCRVCDCHMAEKVCVVIIFIRL